MTYRQGFNQINMTGTTTVPGIDYIWYPQTISNDNDTFIRVFTISTNLIVLPRRNIYGKLTAA